jgi:hypothetical protein
MPHEGEQFLHQKDSKLHTSSPVEHEVARKKRADEEVSQKPADKLADWMEVLERTHFGHRDDPEVQERLKQYYYKENVIKEEDIPDSYYDNQKRLAREQGHGDIEVTEEMKEQLSETLITDQKFTLDKWLDYFTSPDSDSYPMWAKYWSFTNMVKLSSFDKEKHSFAKRDKGTVAPFPDLNREALAYVVDAIIKKVGKEKIEADPEFQKILEGANFAKLYAWAMEKVTPTEQNELLTTEGQWVKYDKGSDHMPLVESLQGHGTGWCTAGESTAQTQLQAGDFYVYYSYDKDGQPTIPRVAIRMQESGIAEVRGIAPDQNLDPYIGGVLKAKLAEFPDGQAYEQKSADMKLLTEIDNKTKAGTKLNKEELTFLYEIDKPIKGFGYRRDPRIEEITSVRNHREDVLIIFDCQPNEIAWNQEEIDENTKAYIGPWNPDIFQIIRNYPNITHLYESFPDKPIFLQTLETDPNINSPKKAEQALEDKNIFLSKWGEDILAKTVFSKSKETYELVGFNIGQLGFPKGATIEQIYQRAQELGLELCPAEVGPQLRLQSDQKRTLIAMKQIADRDGTPNVFHLGIGAIRFELRGQDVSPELSWRSHDEFVFRFRKPARNAST